MDDEKVARVSEDEARRASVPAKDVAFAKQAADDEHNLGFREAVRRYPKAVAWSVLVSTAIIMEGYDIVLISSFFAQPSFRQRYGEYDPGTNSYQISASWQNGLSNAVSVGTIVGAFANGYFTHKFGYRKVLLASLVAICAFIFISFFSPSLPVLLVGQFLCGIPWGVFATMAPSYASEVCPMALRGYLTVYVNLCWALGQLVSAGVQSGFADTQGEWSYRVPFAIQWAWPVPLFVVLFFAPESPWHYVRTGDYESAKRSIARLSSSPKPGHAEQQLAMMIHTNEIEQMIDEGTSYTDCLRGVDRRRTEIACMAFAAQPFCGSAMGGSPTFFFVSAGLPETISFRMSVGGLGIASVGTIVSWWLLRPFGRRQLYLWGLGLLSVVLFTVGFISVGAGDSTSGNFAQAGMMLAWLAIYYTTVGPVCYIIISEASSTRLRNKSICLSRIAYYVAQIICNVINPYMLNPTAGNWKGKTAFFWGGCTVLFFVWTFFRLPETKDKTFEELDILFARNVKARDFAKCQVDAYAEDDAQAITKN
ncbi:general substrate transporter [Microdochium trichocladiopsis]|uniref:General substrate transporter n=1 Tax=Microdochium trichocladiopsis TaxID=1682393 RepID=A0A9P8XYC2_9PEZI|nr:general substrate transporter [Microdochium trichocladiopsis]KAH7025037.1 general substrate transporter [Microdochium trichocladiopsis]